MKKSALVFCKYSRMGASSRLRTYQYLPFLEQNNYDIDVSCLYDDEYLLTYYQTRKRSVTKIATCYFKRLIKVFSAYKYDVVYIEKELFPFLPAVCERLLCYLGVKYIVDYDDAVFHNYDSSKNWLVRLFLSKKIDVVMKSSGVVVVGNHYLCDRAISAGAKEIQTLPTVIDASRYSVRAQASSRDTLVIGWIGSPYTQKYLLAIADDMRALSKKINITLRFIGANEHILPDFHGLNVELIPWSEETEVESIQSFDIGIMPLPDEKFEHGKCGYKLIQYMACGIPVIASDIGVNRDIVVGSRCGLLVDTISSETISSETASWDQAVLSMVSDAEQYRNFSRNALEAVESVYSMQVQQQKLLTVFNEL